MRPSEVVALQGRCVQRDRLNRMVRIEPIDQRDLGVAMQIHTVLLLAHAQEAALLRVSQVVPFRSTAEDVQAGSEYHLGAFHGTELVGSLSLEPDAETGLIDIVTLVVHPGHQRQGIGRRLVQEALRRVEGEVFSVSAAAANAPALAFYAALGFVVYRHGTMGPESLAVVQLRRPLR